MATSPVTMISAQVAETTANTLLPGAGAAISEIVSLFTGDHAAAVAKEASTLNNAIPTFVNEVKTVMTAVNAGQITPTQAVGYLQQAQSIYYTTVAGIIKKGGPCVPSCAIGTESSAGQPAGWISTEPECCNTSGTCNASCCIGCYLVEPTITALTTLINSDEAGSYTIPSAQQNGKINGSPLVPITYTPSAINTVLGSTLAPLVPSIVKAHPYVFGGLALLLVAGIGLAVES